MKQTVESPSFGVLPHSRVGDRTEIQSISAVNLLGNVTEGDEMALNENGSYAQRVLFPLHKVPHRFRSPRDM